jgi:hypothetical protein
MVRERASSSFGSGSPTALGSAPSGAARSTSSWVDGRSIRHHSSLPSTSWPASSRPTISFRGETVLGPAVAKTTEGICAFLRNEPIRKREMKRPRGVYGQGRSGAHQYAKPFPPVRALKLSLRLDPLEILNQQTANGRLVANLRSVQTPGLLCYDRGCTNRRLSWRTSRISNPKNGRKS